MGGKDAVRSYKPEEMELEEPAQPVTQAASPDRKRALLKRQLLEDVNELPDEDLSELIEHVQVLKRRKTTRKRADTSSCADIPRCAEVCARMVQPPSASELEEVTTDLQNLQLHLFRARKSLL